MVWFVLVDWIAACLGGCCVMWFGFWDLLGLILGLGCGDFVVRFIVKLVLGVRVGVWWGRLHGRGLCCRLVAQFGLVACCGCCWFGVLRLGFCWRVGGVW